MSSFLLCRKTPFLNHKLLPLLQPKQSKRLSTVSTASGQTGLSHIHHIGRHPLVYRSIGQQLEASAQKYPDVEALVSCHEGRRFTFAEVLRQVDRLAAAFLDLGLEKGDRIGIWTPNMSSWYLSMMAAARIGCTSVGLNPAYQVPEMEYCINKVGIKAMVAAEGFKTQNYPKMLAELIPELNNTQSPKLSSKRCPSIKSVIIDSENHLPGTHSFSDLIQSVSEADAAQIAPLQPKIHPDSCCNIQFTSGTTGKPKAAMLSHFNFVNNGYHIGWRHEFDQEQHRLCVQTPLFHAYGTVIAIMAALCHGTTLCLPDAGYNTEASIECVKREKCTYLYGTPTMHVDVVTKLKEKRQHLETLKYAVTGGSPCSPQLLKDMMEYLGVEKVKSVFGMTETTAVIFQSLPGEAKDRILSSVGHVQDHIEAKVVDADGNTVPFGTPGELCIRGYATKLGYFEDEAKTREIFGPDRWLRTGDQFVLYPDGYGQIVGRLKEMIIRGGENLFPKEIEDFLNTHPDAIETHVVGVPDERLGEEVAAFMRTKRPLSREDIREFCKGKIAHFKVPRYVVMVEEFPKTTSGKIQKFKLQEIFEAMKK